MALHPLKIEPSSIVVRIESLNTRMKQWSTLEAQFLRVVVDLQLNQFRARGNVPQDVVQQLAGELETTKFALTAVETEMLRLKGENARIHAQNIQLKEAATVNETEMTRLRSYIQELVCFFASAFPPFSIFIIFTEHCFSSTGCERKFRCHN